MRTCKNLLFFGLGLLLAGFSVLSFGAPSVYKVPSPAGMGSINGNTTYTMRTGQTIPLTGPLSSSPVNIPYQTASGATRSIPVPTSVGLNPAAIGSVAIPYLMNMGPLGKAAALAALVCTTTSLCYDAALALKYTQTDGAPTPNKYWSIDYPPSSCYESNIYNPTTKCSFGSAKASFAPAFLSQHPGAHITNTYWETLAVDTVKGTVVYYETDPAMVYISSRNLTPYGTAPSGNSTAPATPADITAATNKMNNLPSANQVPAAQATADAGSPVPAKPPQISPSTSSDAPSVSTQRDSAGNPTTTTTTNNTYTTNPVTNNTTNNTTNIEQITTTSVTNLATNTTTTTTTNQSTPQEQTDSTTVSFDTVPDVDLPTQDLTPPLTYTSFGEGTCPADPAVTYLGKSFVIPFHYVCNAANVMRPIVLLLGVLISGYIVSGVRKAT